MLGEVALERLDHRDGEADQQPHLAHDGAGAYAATYRDRLHRALVVVAVFGIVAARGSVTHERSWTINLLEEDETGRR